MIATQTEIALARAVTVSSFALIEQFCGDTHLRLYFAKVSHSPRNSLTCGPNKSFFLESEGKCSKKETTLAARCYISSNPVFYTKKKVLL